MAKKTISGTNVGLVGTSTVNYIKQISDGTTAHDLALTKGISFFNGADGDAVIWDGTQAIEVVIPSVTDIIQDPVRMVGTVDNTGALPAGYTPSKGDLLYITANCDFAGTNPATACEAGDMAIYDGSAWHVVTGENQTSITTTGAVVSGNDVTHTLSTTAVEVLDVEGKKLKLAVSYPSHTVTKNTVDLSLDVNNGTTAVAAKYVGLSANTGASVDITKSVSISLPSALADGTVTISDKVLQGSDISFDAGSFPTISKNGEAISVSASHGMTIAASGTGSFVTDITAISGITFGEGNSTDKDFGFVASLSAAEGTSFVTDVHTYNSATDSAVAFTAAGAVTVENSVFATGFSAEKASGDVVSSITVGTVSLNADGSGILTGLSTDGNDVVTDVNFGSVITNNSAWFVTGLGEGTDVVTDVTVGAVTFASGNSDGLTGSAIVSAAVSDHVLTFNTGSFMTPVHITQASSTITKGGFTKGGVEISGADTTKGGFTTAALSQAASSVSFKDLATANLGLSQSTVSYALGTAKDHAYTGVMGYTKVTSLPAVPTKSGAVIENPTISVTIPADTVAVGLNAGTLPSLSIDAASGEIGGTVGTALTMSEVSWLAVDPSKKDLAGATTYTLVEDSATFNGAVEVAKAGSYALDDATVTIVSGTYVTDVTVVDPS